AVEGAAFLSTVSHQHYYGLLFKILWPLSTGRPFFSKQLILPGEIATAAALGRCVLVSSPALLKRVGTTPEAIEALAPAHASLAAVFSSGGPLPWDAVRRCTQALSCAPTEVYGSSETGGVAWRLRTRETDPWMPLPGVEVAFGDKRRLRLRSNHLEAAGWTESDDLAVPVEGGFHLLGRADHIVKIEEKRVSLPALERRLVEHPRVSEARVLLLKGARDVLGAVVRLKDPATTDAQGRASLEAEDRRALADALRLHLKDVSDPTALPRRWRFVDELPLDSMGKTTQAVLEALFIGKEVREAECLHVQRLDQGVELHLFLPDSLLWFRGHFPGRPLLPGVVQVHWAILAARKHLDLNGSFQGFRALKFTRPLRPGMRVNLTLTPSKGGFEFSYVSEEGRHAAGRVLLA
ncbi:MAG: AMP-binding protein, partial [bacterium]